MAIDVLDQLTKLRQDEQRCQQRRTEAETVLRVARQRLAEVDKEIRALGVEPDQAEQALAELQTVLAAEIATAQAAAVQELAACDEVLSKLRGVV